MKRFLAICVMLLSVCSFLCGCSLASEDGKKSWFINGFIEENGAVYYYKHGERLTGWQTVDEQKYFFDDDGKMHLGWLVWENEAYYFRKKAPFEGMMFVSESSVVQDVDGIYWYVTFDDDGKVVESVLDTESYRRRDEPVPDVSEPNFGNEMQDD